MNNTRITIQSTKSRYSTNINPNPGYDECTFNVESLVVPDTYYNIYENVVYGFVDSTGTNTFISIPKGNYTATTLLALMVADMTFTDPGATYTAVLLTPSDIWTITSNILLDFSLSLPPIISKYFGYGFGDVLIVSSSQVLTLGIENFIRTKNYYAYSTQNINNGGYIGSGSSNFDTNRTGTLIAVIPTGPLNFFGNFGHHAYTGKINNRWDIILKDENDIDLDLNGHAWSLTLYFR